jgi:hypothetical protein
LKSSLSLFVITADRAEGGGPKVGLFDIFRLKDPIDPALTQAVKDYQRNLAKGEAETVKAVEAIFGGLSDREVSVLMAGAAGLVQVPPRLANRLDLYLARKARLTQAEAEAERNVGGHVDALDAATDLLQRQSWWPEFIANVRKEAGIRTDADIGRWGLHGKQVAPYVWDCGFLFQTPEAVQNDGPVSVWSWRVDLRRGTCQPI